LIITSDLSVTNHIELDDINSQLCSIGKLGAMYSSGISSTGSSSTGGVNPLHTELHQSSHGVVIAQSQISQPQSGIISSQGLESNPQSSTEVSSSGKNDQPHVDIDWSSHTSPPNSSSTT